MTVISRLLLQRKNANYREVLNVCLPLVLSMSATTVMEFTDRVFLANYSIEAISAAAPAGVTAFLFMAFFGGIGGYSSVFIAQYFGSGSNNRIGAVLWQGIYFSLFSGLICWLIAEFATGPIFHFAGHEDPVRVLEEIYFPSYVRAILHISAYTLATFSQEGYHPTSDDLHPYKCCNQHSAQLCAHFRTLGAPGDGHSWCSTCHSCSLGH